MGIGGPVDVILPRFCQGIW